MTNIEIKDEVCRCKYCLEIISGGFCCPKCFDEFEGCQEDDE